MRASVAAEKAGVPAVSIIAAPFLELARAAAKGLGVTEPSIAAYPGRPMIDTDDELREKVKNSLVPQILAGWSERVSGASGTRRPDEPRPRDVVFSGSFQQVQDYFDDQLWSDGLPVAPPTVASVEEFLRYTDRQADEIVGVCPPESREATIWNIAVNGVMAGCRPEYMPVLIAVVEAILDPEFLLEDAGATPGWEPLIILNGPIIKELNFNHGTGVMRVGRRANTSVGRFLRLFMRNVAGQRIPPGVTDKATIGYTFNVVLAEDEDAVRELGWEPYSVDRGFARGENVVTVQSCVSITPPTYSSGSDALNHVQIMSEVIGQGFAYWAYTSMRHRRWYPVIVMSPSVAKAIADDGWNKDDIRKYLYENTRMQAGLAEKYARNTALNDFDLKDMVARGVLPPEYHESDDPQRLIRVFYKSEWIHFVVAGDPGRSQARGYVQSHRHGVPVSRRIGLPRNWRQLIESSDERGSLSG